MLEPKNDWLAEHVRNKRLADEEALRAAPRFMSDEDAEAIAALMGEGATVVGHGLLVAKDGQTLAFMKLLRPMEGEPPPVRLLGAEAAAPSAPSTTSAPAPSAPAGGQQGGAESQGNALKSPSDSNGYINDFVDGIVKQLPPSGLTGIIESGRQKGEQIIRIENEINGR